MLRLSDRAVLAQGAENGGELLLPAELPAELLGLMTTLQHEAEAEGAWRSMWAYVHACTSCVSCAWRWCLGRPALVRMVPPVAPSPWDRRF